jgi:hypothetical protein
MDGGVFGGARSGLRIAPSSAWPKTSYNWPNGGLISGSVSAWLRPRTVGRAGGRTIDRIASDIGTSRGGKVHGKAKKS